MDVVLEQAEGVLEQAAKGKGNGNQVYQALCQLYGLLGSDRSVTRIVALGQQSMGKTTLLNTIMGLPVGFTSSGCGTKCPVEYHLRPSEGDQNPEEFRLWLNGVACEPEELQRKMTDIMKSQVDITEEPLKVEIAGQNLLHGTFVDLPGIQVDDDEKMEVSTRVARAYIEGHPMDVFIMVTKADDDYNNRPAPVLRVMKMLNPKQTIYVATHALAYFEKRVNEKTVTEILDQLNHMHGGHLASVEQYAVELYQLKQEDMGKSMADQKSFMYRKLRERYELILTTLQNATGKRNKAAHSELCRRSDLYEMAKSIEAKFSPTLTNSLKRAQEEARHRYNELQEQKRRTKHQLNELTDGSTHALIEQFVNEFVDRCRKIARGNEENLSLLDDLKNHTIGSTCKENLEQGHEKALELFWSRQTYEDKDYAAIMKRAARYYKNELRVLSHAAADENVKAMRPSPQLEPAHTVGQFVRMYHENGNRLGIIHWSSSDAQLFTTCLNWPNEKNWLWAEGVTTNMMKLLLPIGMTEYCSVDDSAEAEIIAWERYDYNGGSLLRPVRVLKLTNVEGVPFPSEGWHGPPAGVTFYEGKATVRSVDLGDTYNARVLRPRKLISELYRYPYIGEERVIGTRDLFVDTEPDPEEPLEYICGLGWDSKLIASRGFELIGRFMSFIIMNFQPECQLSKEHIFNLQEARANRVSAVSFNGIVEALVQANIDKVLIPLVQLAAAAGSVAMNHVFEAAIIFMSRYGEERYSRILTDAAFMERFKQYLYNFSAEQAVINADTQADMLDRIALDGPCLFEKVRYLSRAWKLLRAEGDTDPSVFESEFSRIKNEFDSQCKDPEFLRKTAYQPLQSQVQMMFLEKADILATMAAENFHADFARVLKMEGPRRVVAGQKVVRHGFSSYLKDQLLKNPDGSTKSSKELEELFNVQRQQQLEDTLESIEPELKVLVLANKCHDHLVHSKVDFLMKLVEPLRSSSQGRGMFRQLSAAFTPATTSTESL